jgi:hypothetical protein
MTWFLAHLLAWWTAVVLHTKRLAAWVGLRLIAWATPPEASAAVVVDPVETAVRSAFGQCGLPMEQFGPRFDLSRTGKLYEVLHYSGLTLGVDHELRTVGDVIAFYREP